MQHAARSEPNVLGIRPALMGVCVTLRCDSCAEVFESLQPEIAGVHAGSHPCPRCGLLHEIGPEAFDRALQVHLPELPKDEALDLNREATRITETWYGAGSLAEALVHRDVALGPPTELYLMSYVLAGLVLDRMRTAA